MKLLWCLYVYFIADFKQESIDWKKATYAWNGSILVILSVVFNPLSASVALI